MSDESSESFSDEIPRADVASRKSEQNRNLRIKQSDEYKEAMRQISDAIGEGKCEATSLGRSMLPLDLVNFLVSMGYEIIENGQFGWKISW